MNNPIIHEARFNHTPRTIATPQRPSRTVLRSEKITDEHLTRLAIVYVRQSTPQQVLEHRESTARQYALADRAVALGWPAAAVRVIDEDQGQRGEDSSLDRGQRLLVGRHPQKGTRQRPEPRRDPPNSECQHLRENTAFTTTFDVRTPIPTNP